MKKIMLRIFFFIGILSLNCCSQEKGNMLFSDEWSIKSISPTTLIKDSLRNNLMEYSILNMMTNNSSFKFDRTTNTYKLNNGDKEISNGNFLYDNKQEKIFLYNKTEKIIFKINSSGTDKIELKSELESIQFNLQKK